MYQVDISDELEIRVVDDGADEGQDRTDDPGESPDPSGREIAKTNHSSPQTRKRMRDSEKVIVYGACTLLIPPPSSPTPFYPYTPNLQPTNVPQKSQRRSPHSLSPKPLLLDAQPYLQAPIISSSIVNHANPVRALCLCRPLQARNYRQSARGGAVNSLAPGKVMSPIQARCGLRLKPG